jgi:predicted transcriptional regulator
MPTAMPSHAQRRHERLKEARSRADTGDPGEITVRELLSLWGARSRGQRICKRIEADLSNHGLVTSPSFRKVTIDATVQLTLIPEEVPISAEVGGQIAEPEDESVELEATLTIGNIVALDCRVAAVAPTASLDEAITCMLLDDYSQIAVLSGKHTLRGAITWKSITQARHRDPAATLADCIVTDAPVAPYDRELMDVLPVLKEHEFVFVRNDQNAIAGILTYADVVRHYGTLSTPFLLIGELDQRLRALIAKTFFIEEITPLCDPQVTRGIGAFDDLTMGDYQQVLGNPNMWAKLGWPLDRHTFVSRLDEMRQARNDVMHFNPDGIPDETVAKLRALLSLLRTYC